MCERAHMRRPNHWEVEHVHQLSTDIGNLFENSEYSDITFAVDDKKFPAHKVVMAARSQYFRALLFGGMSESRGDVNEIVLKETSATGFRLLLQYIYTGRLMLSNLQEELVLEVLSLANRYGFTELQSSISEYLQDSLSKYNVCLIYDLASIYCLNSLANSCLSFIDQQAIEIMSSNSFIQLSQNALIDIISRDSFCADEIDIFRAVGNWIEGKEEADISKVVGKVRLHLIKRDDLTHQVRDSGLVDPNLILDAITEQDTRRGMELRHRGLKLAEVNVATVKHGARVLTGEMKTALLDGDTTNYDLDRGFSRHSIDDDTQCGIVIKLAHPYIINCMRLLLWDRDMRSYSYYIEVSTDERDWLRVVDYSNYLCRSWQTVHFPATVARFIRVAGTHNTVNRVFHLVGFECMFTQKDAVIDDGVMVPDINVASIDMSALVIEGVSRSRNALINGETCNYDWDSGYTCHQLGSGAITIQLAQPYMIDSMRLLLWDCDDRGYRFYIETSVDQLHWSIAADYRLTEKRGWLAFRIEKRPVCFIRITGTYNSANEVFHIVHFECPCSKEQLAVLPPVSRPPTTSGSTVSTPRSNPLGQRKPIKQPESPQEVAASTLPDLSVRPEITPPADDEAESERSAPEGELRLSSASDQETWELGSNPEAEDS